MQHCSSEKLGNLGVHIKKIKCRTCDPRAGLHLDQNDYFTLPRTHFLQKLLLLLLLQSFPLEEISDIKINPVSIRSGKEQAVMKDCSHWLSVCWACSLALTILLVSSIVSELLMTTVS